MRYIDCPNVNKSNGVWPACGINEANMAMTATETITSNARVVGADPYVRYQAKKGRNSKEVPGGIGEGDLVTLVLFYIHSAREGVLRTNALLGQYGTYEPNGMAFADADEVWRLENIGGHHCITRRVPDDRVVVMPNQLGLDHFDFGDAYGEQKEHLCSQNLQEFVGSTVWPWARGGVQPAPEKGPGASARADVPARTGNAPHPRAQGRFRCAAQSTKIWPPGTPSYGLIPRDKRGEKGVCKGRRGFPKEGFCGNCTNYGPNIWQWILRQDHYNLVKKPIGKIVHGIALNMVLSKKCKRVQSREAACVFSPPHRRVGHNSSAVLSLFCLFGFGNFHILSLLFLWKRSICCKQEHSICIYFPNCKR